MMTTILIIAAGILYAAIRITWHVSHSPQAAQPSEWDGKLTWWDDCENLPSAAGWKPPGGGDK
jgi:hypothetical protein